MNGMIIQERSFAATVICIVSLSIGVAQTSAQRTTSPTSVADSQPKLHELSARASVIDPRVKSHPEINFLIETASGKPADIQKDAVDTRVAPQGKLVIWLMSHNQALFDRVTSYGLHAIQIQYARSWFSICCQEKPVGPHCRGNIRLEAATGEDFSDEVQIPKPDGARISFGDLGRRLRRRHRHLLLIHTRYGLSVLISRDAVTATDPTLCGINQQNNTFTGR